MKNKRMAFWIALGSGSLLILLVAIYFIVLPLLQPSTPQRTAQSFCDAVNTGDLHRAYGQLSQEPYVLDPNEASLDHTMQNVAHCTIRSVKQSDATHAVASTSFGPRPHLEFSAAAIGYLSMDLENGTWKITEVVPGVYAVDVAAA